MIGSCARIVAPTLVFALGLSVTLTRYQAGAARVVICEDGRGFVVFHPGGIRDEYGTGSRWRLSSGFIALKLPGHAKRPLAARRLPARVVQCKGLGSANEAAASGIPEAAEREAETLRRQR